MWRPGWNVPSERFADIGERGGLILPEPVSAGRGPREPESDGPESGSSGRSVPSDADKRGDPLLLPRSFLNPLSRRLRPPARGERVLRPVSGFRLMGFALIP
jgi:hypothetical protein